MKPIVCLTEAGNSAVTATWHQSVKIVTCLRGEVLGLPRHADLFRRTTFHQGNQTIALQAV